MAWHSGKLYVNGRKHSEIHQDTSGTDLISSGLGSDVREESIAGADG
jgi:hypothetical protein